MKNEKEENASAKQGKAKKNTEKENTKPILKPRREHSSQPEAWNHKLSRG